MNETKTADTKLIDKIDTFIMEYELDAFDIVATLHTTTQNEVGEGKVIEIYASSNMHRWV